MIMPYENMFSDKNCHQRFEKLYVQKIIFEIIFAIINGIEIDVIDFTLR